MRISRLFWGPRGVKKCQNVKNLDFSHVPPKLPNGPQICSIASRNHIFRSQNAFFGAGGHPRNPIPLANCLWAGFQMLQWASKTAPEGQTATLGSARKLDFLVHWCLPQRWSSGPMIFPIASRNYIFSPRNAFSGAGASPATQNSSQMAFA